MKRRIIAFVFALCLSMSVIQVSAQSITYTVRPGDTMWKIAEKYQVGISEILAQNTQIKNASLIYPGQKLSIPNISDIKAVEDQVLKLVNTERSKRGLILLGSNWQLARVARYKSQDMISKGYFDHTSPTYGTPFQMMESFGLRFSAAGENIAMGQRTAQEVMTAWMNSPGHRSNILSPSYTQLGVGFAKDRNGRCYWTQMFIKPLK